MKVLFSNPPWWTGEVVKNGDQVVAYGLGVRAGSRWPSTFYAPIAPDNFRFGSYLPYPFFMGYAATYAARETGAEMVFRDSIALRESYQSFQAFLQAMQPDFIVIESASPSWPHDIGLIRRLAVAFPRTKVIVTGPIATQAASMLDEPVHAWVNGEYEKGVVRVLAGESGIIPHDLLTREEMNAAPFPYYDSTIAHRYWDENPKGQAAPQAQVWSSRGCPYRCLSGDTPVNTIEGMIPIGQLVAEGRREVGVYTYDRSGKRAKISLATNIRQYGRDKLVRVHFDDDTHVDCTPDHRFLAFKWGNQNVGEREWECEAKDLTPGMHLRAIKESAAGQGYREMSWSRRGREKKHRMVAEFKIGRPLLPTEEVHHKDRNKTNNRPDNLEVMASTKEHFAEHPEFAERMRTSNPTKDGIDAEWAENIGAANRGKVRSDESKERYRAAAVLREASQTPEEKSARAKRGAKVRSANGFRGNPNRDEHGQFTGPIVNHRVVSVEELPGEHDVFCMTVPDTGWFYANNVLVANCTFCVWPATMTGNDPDGTKPRSVRHYTPDYMEAFLSELVGKYRYRTIYFDDDTFNLGDKHVERMCGVMRKIGVPWSAMCRADTSRMELWQEMKDSGCFGVKIGFESGNQWVVDNLVKKKLDLGYARAATEEIKRVGLTVHGTFTFGLPGETAEQMQDTKRFIASLGLDTHQESGCAEIEGTPLHSQHATDDGYIREADGRVKLDRMRSALAG